MAKVNAFTPASVSVQLQILNYRTQGVKEGLSMTLFDFK
jgi:hypothetical protein